MLHLPHRLPTVFQHAQHCGRAKGSPCWLDLPPLLLTPPTLSQPAPSLRAAIGDMFDVSTSPNEPLLFPLHHANLDRSAMMWQAAGGLAG